MNFKLLALTYLLALHATFSLANDNNPPQSKSIQTSDTFHNQTKKRSLSIANKPSKTTMEFQSAVISGNFEIAELLLKQGADINCGNCNDFNSTPLMIRTIRLVDANASMEPVKWLINHGAVINKQDKQGKTPLMQAARYATFTYADGESLLNYFLKNGANPAIKDHDGFNTLHYLSLNTPVAIGANGYDPEYTKIMNSNFENAVRNVNAGGAKINETSNSGLTPLLIASEKCNPVVIKLLLSLGANQSAKDLKGNTALNLALNKAAGTNNKDCNEVVESLK